MVHVFSLPMYPTLPLPQENMLHFMARRYVKNLYQILGFWNLWVKGFQMVYRLSKLVDILEQALKILFYIDIRAALYLFSNNQTKDFYSLL